MNFLAEIADHHNKLEEWLEFCQQRVPAFNVTKEPDGNYDSTSLQGGQCRKLRAELSDLIEATGVSNTQWVKRDIGGERRDLNKQCQALHKNGIRCHHKKQGKENVCGSHLKARTEKHRVAICPVIENVQWVEIENDFKTHLVKCGEALSFVLDAIQKMSPYDDDQYLCHMQREGRKVERPNLHIPLSCLETRESEEHPW